MRCTDQGEKGFFFFKILLFIDNTPGHPKTLLENHSEINVVFMPENRSILKPIYLGVILNVKVYYLRNTFHKGVAAIHSDFSEDLDKVS